MVLDRCRSYALHISCALSTCTVGLDVADRPGADGPIVSTKRTIALVRQSRVIVAVLSSASRLLMTSAARSQSRGDQMTNEHLNPGRIMQTATAFWASKVLLTAVELDLFTTLADGTMTAPQLGDALGLHPRGTYDFFDALVALKFLDRDGDGR